MASFTITHSDTLAKLLFYIFNIVVFAPRREKLPPRDKHSVELEVETVMWLLRVPHTSESICKKGGH